jgi:hypothetical protein
VVQQVVSHIPGSRVQKLFDKAYTVHTLTSSVSLENPFEKTIKIYPFTFNTPEKSKKAVECVAVFL